MSFGTRRGRGTRRTVAAVAATAVLWSFASAAMAETYATPGNEAQVGTNGSDANGQYLAVSDYGTSSSGGLALNYLGPANGGLAGLSVVGPTSGTAALSGIGSANGQLAAASGTGSASSQLLAVSPTGSANGWAAAVSGTGNATSTTYNGLAVSGTGTASSGAGGVAVSPGGNASGGLATATVWGNASGGTVNADPSRTQGTIAEAAYTVTSTGEFVYHTSVNVANDPYQAWLVATNPPDPLGIGLKEIALAEVSPGVAQNMAEGLLTPPPGSPESAQSGSDSASALSSNRPPSQIDLGIGPLTYSEPYGCVPGAAYTVFAGMPGQQQLAHEMGTPKAKGTTFAAAAPVVRRHYSGGDYIYGVKLESTKDLLDRVTTDIWRFGHGLNVGMDPAVAHWPAHRHASHAVSIVGYNHNSSGYLTLVDGYYTSMSAYQWGTRNGQGSSVPVPMSRRWYLSAATVYSAIKAIKSDDHDILW
jgi:hypothetical protein